MIRALLAGTGPALFLPLLLRYVPSTSVWPAVLVYHLYALAAPAVLGRPRGATPAPGGARRSGALTLAISATVLVGAAFVRAWFAKHPRLPFVPPLEKLAPWDLFVAYSLLLNPVIEERFWRGFVLRGCGLWASSLLFWLAHLGPLLVLLPLPWAVLLSLGPLAAGLAWGRMYEKLGSLWPCVITHLAADGAILWVIAAVRSSPA